MRAQILSPIYKTAALSVSALALIACGGGSDSAAPTPPPMGTIPPVSGQTFVTVTGEIDGFGSIIVNGTRYNTDTANVRKDGEDADLSDLSVGQIISLRARRNGDDELPTALRVRYEEVLNGPVESIAADGRSLVILGQTVFLTESTVYEDDLDPALIAVDDVLEISGSFTANGDIVASYIEASDDVDSDYEVHGTVGALNETEQTFRVKGLRVGYASAQLEDFEDGNVLSNGDKVEVEGSVFLNDGTLVATRVEYEGDDLEELIGEEADDDDDEEVEIEGFITAFTDSSNFEVNGQAVQTTAQTEFEYCSAENLALNVEVEVEGEYNAEGVLIADEVECEREPNIFVTALVDDVDLDASLISLLGISISVDMDTSFQDKSEPRIRNFGLDDIQIGDLVRIQAFELLDSEELIAKRIRREDSNDFDGPEIKGDVSNSDPDNFRVSGIAVLFDESAEYELDEEDVTREAFFAAITIGDRVKAEGFEDEDGNFTVTEIERDDDDDEDGDDD